MRTAIYKSFENGYFKFTFENGEDMYFEEIHPKVLHQFDLKNDSAFLEQAFYIIYTENFVDSDDDVVIYRIENLKLLP